MKSFKLILILVVLLSGLISCNKDPDSIYPEDKKDAVNVGDSDIESDAEKNDIDSDLNDEADDINDMDTDSVAEDDQEPADDSTDDVIVDDDKIDDKDEDADDTDNAVDPVCGNGIVEFGEDCDKGDLNSNEPGEVGITCRLNCTYAECGDQIIDAGEICDDGNSDDNDYCSADCKVMTGSCGDGEIQANEACDKATFGDGIADYCADDCSLITGSCGDGVVQSVEVCDKSEEGDGIGPFYCSDDCQERIGRCGDGTKQDNEACDDGTENGKYGKCSSDCDGPGSRCGDGVRDIGHEECDDGNEDSGDYCSSDCQTVTGFCGDGTKQDNEACDKASGDLTVYCADDCLSILGRCGDGTTQDNEDCDLGEDNGKLTCDYSEESCTVCTSMCKSIAGQTSFCGDGRVDVFNGEYCDRAEPDVGDGQGIGAYCTFDCKAVDGSCGDGVKQTHEACDNAETGDGIGPYYCDSKCENIIGSCGDKTKQDNEDCDEGSSPNQYCSYTESECQVCNTDCEHVPGITGKCGDSIIQRVDCTGYLNCAVFPGTGEECDDGSENGSYNKCKNDCSGIGATCGDGMLQRSNCDGYSNCTEVSGADEECDDGAENGDYDKCKNDCSGVSATCGDGMLQRSDCTGYSNCSVVTGANEECDDGGENGDYNKCKNDCSGITSSCGDGVIQRSDCTGYTNCVELSGASEECDDAGDNGKYGYCNSTCSAPMPRCGDNTRDVSFGEACDDGLDNGSYVADFPGSCNLNCQGYGEGGYCGDGITEEGPEEACDHGGLITEDCEYGQLNCEVCDSTCQLIPGKVYTCGDGVLQRADCTGYSGCDTVPGANEECDSGASNGDYGKCNATCSGVSPFCGDGVIHREDCTGYDNCVVFAGVNEECDDGGENGSYGKCENGCSGIGRHCGDGVNDPEEVCDNGENNGSYKQDAPGYCNNNCQGYGDGGFCGDGTPDSEEVCDSGDNNGEYKLDSPGYCNNNCQGYGEGGFCGDGFDNGGESCDDGAENGNYNKCKSDCSGIGPYCGDGNPDTPEEACDLGEDNGATDCNYGDQSCQVCSDECVQSAGNVVGWCGDGTPQYVFDEECDNGASNGAADCSYGESGCYVCTDQCKQVEGNVIGWCGDDIQQSGFGENCDDGENNGVSGYCSDDCSYVTSCGDGTVDIGEYCDTNPVSCTMASQFQSGEIPCPNDCGFPADISACVEDPSYVSPFFTTSQTVCYNNTGTISCPSSGSAFYGQDPQFNYTSQSLSVSGDVVEEAVSGLMWQKDTPSSYSGCTQGTGSSQCTFAEASQYCADLDIEGHDDWRLPTSHELMILVDFSQTQPLIFSDFTNTVSGKYWTSDSAVSFSDGFISSEDPANGAYVKCVRGESSGCAGCSFDGYETVDNLIIVPVDFDANEITFWYYSSSQSSVDWEDALDYCEGITQNGFSNFRLPTVNELYSLVDRSSSNPASYIDTLPGSVFWTSTTLSGNAEHSYVIDFSDGDIASSVKTGTANIICVK